MLVRKELSMTSIIETRPLIDGFGRRISYLRISVTDRCDFRCQYCMAEDMQFIPKKEVLSIEELDTIATAFVARGVKKLRLTGGEPLVRRGIVDLVERLSRHLKSGALGELTLTTNGSQLRQHAQALARFGVKRINVSVDTLDTAKFTEITRRGRLEQVLDGIEAAQEAGLKVKINAVALRDFNDAEIPSMLRWAHERDMDLTLIETMPLGAVDVDRTDQYLPLSEMRARLEQEFTLVADDHYTGGPARYYRIAETNGRLGLITPLTHNFCETCNRVRLTATGELYLCLGQNDKVNLRDALRTGGQEALDAMLDTAMRIKPKGHDFVIDRTRSGPAVERFMSATGG
jgi:cyclic pyranopterin phosphate synthase